MFISILKITSIWLQRKSKKTIEWFCCCNDGTTGTVPVLLPSSTIVLIPVALPILDKDSEKASRLYYLIKEYDILFYVSPEGVEIEDNGIRETDAKYRQLIDNSIRYFISR